MAGTEGLASRHITSSIVELVLLFPTNLFLSDDVPVSLLTLIICYRRGGG